MTKRKEKKSMHAVHRPVLVRIEVGWRRPWLARFKDHRGVYERAIQKQEQQQKKQPDPDYEEPLEEYRASVSLRYGDVYLWERQHYERRHIAHEEKIERWRVVYPSKEAAVQAAVQYYRDGLAARRLYRREYLGRQLAVDLKEPWKNICIALFYVAILALGSLPKKEAIAQLKATGLWKSKRKMPSVRKDNYEDQSSREVASHRTCAPGP